jgi:DNA-binding response OmpR family regulator
MGRYLIAVVNDDKPYIEMMAEVLGDEGYSAISCLAGAGAYALIQREQPDLVILDLKLEQPDSGMNVLQMLRLDRETLHLPVIVCSADTPFLMVKAHELRAHRCDILHKPFSLDDLLATIVRNLPKQPRRARSPNAQHHIAASQGCAD